MPRLQGEQHPLHKLTAEQVRTIRAGYTPGLVTYAALAAEHGVSKQTISRVLAGHTWRHVTNEP